jgi:isopentenyl-diphosphate Delta-isomerase
MIEVVLVDEHDHPIGTAEKVAAHRPPAPLHRACSLVLFDDWGRTLLQQRSRAKYHFGSLWANSCCGHPLPGESVLAAAARRCRAELGVELAEARVVTAVTYSAVDPRSGLMEHEFDHVLIGRIDATPRPDPDEVADLRWIALPDLCAELEHSPHLFAPWLPHIIDGLRRVAPKLPGSRVFATSEPAPRATKYLVSVVSKKAPHLGPRVLSNKSAATGDERSSPC